MSRIGAAGLPHHVTRRGNRRAAIFFGPRAAMMATQPVSEAQSRSRVPPADPDRAMPPHRAVARLLAER